MRITQLGINDSDNENPFISFNEERSDSINIVPSFKKNKTVNVRISEEAYDNLRTILDRYTHCRNEARDVSELIEHIGLGALMVIPFPRVVDRESGVSTDDCRESGFHDGLNGNPQYFLAIYGQDGSVYHRSYLRGYLEGAFIRSKG